MLGVCRYDVITDVAHLRPVLVDFSRETLFGSGVYFEKVLKSSDTSLWVRNIQMYLSGIAVTFIGVVVTDGAKVMEKGFFYGYTPGVCLVICELKPSSLNEV